MPTVTHCRRLLATLCLYQVLATVAAPAVAAGNRDLLSVIIENDAVYDTDRHYTSGVAVQWLSAPGAVPALVQDWPGWLPFPDGAVLRHSYGMGQNMYTPRNTAVRYPPADERPYAGWLYGSFGLLAESDAQLDQFELAVGMVGPASGARQAQTLIHQIIDANEAKGWDTQLGNELGIILSYQRSWHRQRVPAAFAGLDMELIPHAGGAIGNIHTYANAGATVRLGSHLPRDYGPPHIQPSLPGSGFFLPHDGFGWYVFAGLEGRLVARNLFLDGNSFKNSRKVEKEPWVGDLQFGVVLTWPGLRLAYTHVLRSQEFKEQDEDDNYGSFSVSMPF